MANKSYISGIRRERQIVNVARANNLIAFRSAGSHSPIDCVIIDTNNRKIEFIQVKNKKVYGKEKKEIDDLSRYSDEYFVEFKPWTIDNLVDKRKKQWREKKNQ